MRKKMDVMITLGLAKAMYAIEFTKNPYKCIKRLGTREEMQDRVIRNLEMKYAE